jgi:hypothetical protein
MEVDFGLILVLCGPILITKQIKKPRRCSRRGLGSEINIDG